MESRPSGHHMMGSDENIRLVPARGGGGGGGVTVLVYKYSNKTVGDCKETRLFGVSCDMLAGKEQTSRSSVYEYGCFPAEGS